MSGRVRLCIRVEGVVQGVGFRPFVYTLAVRLGLSGRVGNDLRGVFVEVEGTRAQVDQFLSELESHPPPLAAIERITTTEGEPTGGAGFVIAASDGSGQRHTLVSADSATCDDCLRELADPADRRYRYPFVNCTNCGPRFTIVRDVPYDRPATTMADFAMCAECAAEYHDPADRRFHAQPTCCPACGPRLRLLDRDGTECEGDPIDAAAGLLRAGRVLAVKGLVGYHLAVLASNEAAVATLRRRKHREDKPFAVMVSDVDVTERLCTVDAAAVAMLTGRRRPIVLLARTHRHRSRPRSHPATAGSASCCPTPRCTTCPALFDLGEHIRAVVMSVTEGADKPLKYPHMFHTADVVLLNKIDLLPYVDFPLDTFHDTIRRLHHGTEILHLSATRGDGVREWYRWLREHPAVAGQ